MPRLVDSTRSSRPKVAAAAVALSCFLTLAPSTARAQEEITEDLNTAAAALGIAVLAADLGFTVADTMLAVRKERLSRGWSIVEIVCAAPIAAGAVIYSFQAREEELLYTIPIAAWTGVLTVHGILSLTASGKKSSLAWAPTYATGRPGIAILGWF